MNTALPITAKMQNAQSIQQIQYQNQETKRQETKRQDAESCQQDKEAKAAKANKIGTVDKINVDNVDKETISTQPTPSTVTLQLNTELRILRIKDVAEKLSIGKSTIYDWLNKKSPRYDETFPKPIKLSPKSIGWLSTEIDAWLLAKAEQTRVCDFG